MKPLLPPAVIGMIGGGQLGMMTLREARRMGYRSVVWDPNPECPASKLADRVITAPFNDEKAARELADASDVVTYEFENVDPGTVETIESMRPVFPGSPILRIAQHRRREKEALQKAGFPLVKFVSAVTPQELTSSAAQIRAPWVIKTATSGYDGKGQAVLEDDDQLRTYVSDLADPFPERILEEYVDLHLEVSVIAVRTSDGQVKAFPLLENEHRENILHVTRVPADVTGKVRKEALELGRAVIAHFGIVGVLCIEMFITSDERVLVNELAPRPHNSGHFSLDAASISQFEALVRCACGLPMQEPQLLTPCAMVNLLGKHLDRIDLVKAQSLEGSKVHLYGKTKREPKRKMGHVTVLGRTAAEVEQKVGIIEALIGEDHPKGARNRRQRATMTAVEENKE